MSSKELKLSGSELAICKRLTNVRALAGYEQKTMAEALGISRDRLASYENFRAPVRYSVGDRLCAIFDLNQRWLATGDLPQVGYDTIAGASEVPSRMLFSEAYHKYLDEIVVNKLVGESVLKGGSPLRPVEEMEFHYISHNERRIRHLGGVSIDPATLLCPILLSRIKEAFASIPPTDHARFYRHMGRAMTEFRSGLPSGS